MCEVKTELCIINKRTCLMNVVTEDLSESRLKKMHSRVVSSDSVSALCIKRSFGLVAYFNYT